MESQVGIAPKYLSQIENGKVPRLSVEGLGRLGGAMGAEPGHGVGAG